MYSPYSDLEKMFWTPSYILFRCTIDGQEYLGRPQHIHMGDVYDQKFKHCVFQYWDSLGQYHSSTMPKIIEELGKPQVVIGLEAIDTLSKKEPSELSELLSACNEIAQLDDLADMGTLSIKVPEILENLYEKIEKYGSIHPKAYIANPLYNINECKSEFENIDTTLNTDQYRRDKIRNLKERISTQIHQLFSLSEPER